MAEPTSKSKMVDFVRDQFKIYEGFHSGRFEKSRKYRDYWHGKAPVRDHTWQNAVHVPVTVEAEQTISPRLFTALFPNDAPVDVKVEQGKDPKQGIKIKFHLQHHFRVSNVQGQFAQMLPQCTVYGTGYAEAGSWFVRNGWQLDKEGQRYYTKIEARPNCQYIDYFEIYPHPAKLYMWDGLGLIRKRTCDAEFIKSLAENPFFKFDNLKEALESENPTPTPHQGKVNKEYELLEYWGPYDHSYEKDGKQLVDKAVPYWIIVINRKVLVRGMPNPYNHQMPPFIKIKLFEDVKPSWFGVGIGEIGAPAQERLNKIVNQRLDNVDLVLAKQGSYNGNDTLIDKNKLRVMKPQWHKCSDPLTSFKMWDVPDVTASSYKEEELAKQDFREATGATTPIMPGEPSEQHRTAMGIQLLQGAAGIRFRPILRMMEVDGIQQCAMFYFSNLQQFMSTEEWVLKTSDDGTTEPIVIRPEDIQAKVFFIPTGISETVNKEVQVGQLLRYKEITMNDPTINRQEINKRIAELFGFKEIQKFLVPVVPQSPAGPGGLPQDTKQRIMQRMTEGATPEQIKEELLGPPPAPEPQEQKK